MYAISQKVLIRIAIVTAIALAILVLVFVADDYVPTSEKLLSIYNPTACFIVNAQDVRGIYGNMDVDCVLYEYTTSVDPKEFWNRLHQSATEVGWKLAEQNNNQRRYFIIIPATGKAVEHDAEEVRVAFLESSNKVLIGWVQADTRVLPIDFPSESSEAAFADRFLWPRFERIIAESETSTTK